MLLLLTGLTTNLWAQDFENEDFPEEENRLSININWEQEFQEENEVQMCDDNSYSSLELEFEGNAPSEAQLKEKIRDCGLRLVETNKFNNGGVRYILDGSWESCTIEFSTKRPHFRTKKHHHVVINLGDSC